MQDQAKAKAKGTKVKGLKSAEFVESLNCGTVELWKKYRHRRRGLKSKVKGRKSKVRRKTKEQRQKNKDKRTKTVKM